MKVAVLTLMSISKIIDGAPRSVSENICLSVQSPGGSANEIFAKLEVYLWLGLAKYSKDVTTGLPEEFMPVYEEDEEEQRWLVTAGRRKLPVSLSCQGETAGGMASAQDNCSGLHECYLNREKFVLQNKSPILFKLVNHEALPGLNSSLSCEERPLLLSFLSLSLCRQQVLPATMSSVPGAWHIGC